MDWDAVGAIGNLVGGVGVVATLATRIARSQPESHRTRHAELLKTLHEGARCPSHSARANRALGAEPRPFVAELMRQTGVTEEEATLAYWEQFAWWQHQVYMVLMLNQLTEGEAKAFAVNTPRAYGGPPWAHCSIGRCN